MTAAQTVLYVEDEENDVFFMQLAWERAGLTADLRVAADGAMAIDYLAGEGPFADRGRHPIPSLVILDLNLPVISGLQVLEWIRRRAEYSGLPVVILSSSDQPHDIERGRELRANDFITKPSAPADLIGIVQGLSETWLTHPTDPVSIPKVD